jgi:beta-lactamase regulating signal transducer with metallopeptidase domain
MRHPRQHRFAFLIAILAIAFAIAIMLIPHVHNVGDNAALAILPHLFVGLISPLSLLSPLAFAYRPRTPNAPVLPASFQRPPPFQLA